MFEIRKTRAAPPTIVIAGKNIGDVPLPITDAEYEGEKRYIDGLVEKEFILLNDVVGYDAAEWDREKLKEDLAEAAKPDLPAGGCIIEGAAEEPEPDLRVEGVADPDPDVPHPGLDEEPETEEQVFDLSLLDGSVKNLKAYIEEMDAGDLPWLGALIKGEVSAANRKTAIAAIEERITELEE